MPPHTFTIGQAAYQLATSPSTVRRWCAEFSAYLSPAASPDSGQQRRLSERDMEVLKEVARLRNTEGLTTAQINERLAGLVFPDPAAIQPAHAAQDAPSAAQTALVVVEALRSVELRLQALEQGQEELQHQRLRIDATIIFIAGLIIGAIIASAWAWFR